jgi:hypothetical protein
MTKLERIAEDHRVAIRNVNHDGPVIPGHNGHLYTDDGKVMVCFTDDGRRTPFSTRVFKTCRLKILRPYILQIKQEGDYEFIAEVEDTDRAVRMALRILHVKHLRIDHGVPRPLSDKFIEAARAAAARRRKPKEQPPQEAT